MASQKEVADFQKAAMSDQHSHRDSTPSRLDARQILLRLSEPFPSADISWRAAPVSGQDYGRALPFLDARNVQDRLDEVLGINGWRDEYVEVTSGAKVVAVRCKLSAYVEGNWVTKEDAAPMDLTSSLELGVKGAYSDALKRAAVKFGVGRYLYALRAPLVMLDKGQYLPADFDGRMHLAPEMVPAHEREELQQLQAQAVQLKDAGKGPVQAKERDMPKAPHPSEGQELAAAQNPAPAEPPVPSPTEPAVAVPAQEASFGEPGQPTPAPEAPASAASEGGPSSDDEELLKGVREKLEKGTALLPLKTYLGTPKVRGRLTEKTRLALLMELEKKLK